jgi:regulator of protease activity HflC (stomatin/prohibitin superfamily)
MMTPSSIKPKGIFIGIVLAVMALFGLSSIRVVDAGEQAVVVRLGVAQPNTLAPGLHFVIPVVDSVYTFSTRTRKIDATANAASRDLQQVTTTIALNFQLNPQSINKLYQEIGIDWQSRIVDPAIQESVKSATSIFSAEELITKRQELKDSVTKLLADRLKDKYIIVDQISITDFRFSTEFDKAIEAKQVAEQNALKAKQDLERIKIEGDQRIAQARAEAEALRLQKENLSADLLQLRAIEKWDGKLPQATGGSTPFITLK